MPHNLAPADALFCSCVPCPLVRRPPWGPGAVCGLAPWHREACVRQHILWRGEVLQRHRGADLVLRIHRRHGWVHARRISLLCGL